MLAPALVQLLDLVRRRVAREVPQARAADVSNPVRAAGGKVHLRVGPGDFRLAAGGDLPTGLDAEAQRPHPAALLDRRAPPPARGGAGAQQPPRAAPARA